MGLFGRYDVCRRADAHAFLFVSWRLCTKEAEFIKMRILKLTHPPNPPALPLKAEELQLSGHCRPHTLPGIHLAHVRQKDSDKRNKGLFSFSWNVSRRDANNLRTLGSANGRKGSRDVGHYGCKF